MPAAILLLQRTDTDITLKDFEGYTAFDLYNSTVEGTRPVESETYVEPKDIFTWGANRYVPLHFQELRIISL